MDNYFTRAALADPPKILGVRLRPFSCWHSLLLSLFDSPFLDGRAITIESIVMALLICSGRYRDGLRRVSGFRHAWVIRARLRWAMAFADLDREIKRLTDYMALYFERPSYWQTGDCKHSRIPYPFWLAATLQMRINGMTAADIWDMPMGLACGYESVIAEEHGMEIADDDLDGAVNAERDWEDRAARGVRDPRLDILLGGGGQN